MKNTHGKCFIISSSSPTALWHRRVIRKNFPLGKRGVGWQLADTLSFPVGLCWRNLLWFPPGPIPWNPSLFAQAHSGPTPQTLQCLKLKVGIPGNSCTNMVGPWSHASWDMDKMGRGLKSTRYPENSGPFCAFWRGEAAEVSWTIKSVGSPPTCVFLTSHQKGESDSRHSPNLIGPLASE